MRLLPWNCDQQSFRERIEDLRFKYHKWDVFTAGQLRFLPAVLVLSRTEHFDLCERASMIACTLAGLESRIRHDDSLIRRLAIADKLIPLAAQEPVSSFQFARYDFIPCNKGWRIPEFNEDAPGGFNEAIGATALFSDALPGGAVFPATPADSLLEAFPEESNVGLVYATGYSEDLQHMLMLQSLLEQHAYNVVKGSPEHLRRKGKKYYLSGQPIDWLFRFFPAEWFSHVEDLSAWLNACADIAVLNPLSRMIRQSKLLFALWREPGVLESESAEMLNLSTPETALFEPSKKQHYAEAKDSLVIKHAFGRMGDSVSVGALMTDQQWIQDIDSAAKQPECHLTQERFIPNSLEFNGEQWFPAVGVYLVNGEFGGYYSRVDRKGFTTNEATYVATAVESA